MDNNIQDVIRDINSQIKDCETYLFITRDKTLQMDAATRLVNVREQAAALKLRAVSANNGDLANLFLGFECVAECLLAELDMWIHLKNDKPDEAWDCLVNAQTAAAASARAHRGFSHNGSYVNRLEEIERLVFPPQVFMSAGLIVKRQECSICGAEYGECDHLAGRPYMGQFCAIVPKEITANHVAVVKDPADKRCRIMNFTTEEGTRDRMTWRLAPSDTAKTDSDNEMSAAAESPGTLTCTAIILTSGN